LEKGVPIHFNKLEALLPRMIYGQNWPCGSGEEVKNVKVYRQTDDGQHVIRIAHFNFQVR
jgi:hypothetical protein